MVKNSPERYTELMISFDLECAEGHRFEGIFRDYSSFEEQLNEGKIQCPFCGTAEVKRLFSGCAIQAKSLSKRNAETITPNFFEYMRMVQSYVKENFENVGKDFAETARAIHYGIEEERNIYGESSPQEMKDLVDEGIGVVPLVDVSKLEN